MVGIDIVAIGRIERIIARSGEEFLRRFLNSDEIKQCVFDNGRFNIQRIAGFYATKEALSKALGCGIGKDLAFSDINIIKNKSGKPKIKLKKCVKKIFHIKKIYLSISHERNRYHLGEKSGYAIAMVVIKKN